MLPAMKRTWVGLAVPVVTLSFFFSLGLASQSAPAHAENAFILVGGGLLFPMGDDDWENVAEASPTVFVRGGGGRLLNPRARLMIEGSFEVTPISTNFEDNAIFQLDLTRFRALIGVRYEQLVSRGVLLALRGGIGIDHLRGEVTTPLGSESQDDTGLALEVGIGPWFSAGSVLMGFELALPVGLHDDDGTFDFRSTDLAMVASVRFRL